MNRLTVQHPQLTDAKLAAICQQLGQNPSLREPTVAQWSQLNASDQLAAELATRHAVDAHCVPADRLLGNFRLLVFDMDSTLINIECIDEIADFAGRKAEVAAITEAAMRGEITDYDDSLRRRVALLAGLSESALADVYIQRLRITEGATELIAAAKAVGMKVLLVSGGFTYFTSRVQALLGIDYVRSNQLEIASGQLTGRLVGTIVNADIKRDTVVETCARLGCGPEQAIVVGDGANDLKMMAVAGLSVAFHAKPKVREQASLALNYCGLDALLRLFS